MRISLRHIIIPLLLIIATSSAAFPEIIEVDTSITRDVTKIKKSFGEKLADLPGEILKLPLYTTEYIIYTVSTNPPMSKIIPLLDFGREARPYIPIVGYNSNAGLKFGLGLKHSGLFHRQDYGKFKWYYSTNRYQSYQFKYHGEYFISRKAGINISLRYRKKPRESFYGVGNDSPLDNQASYTLERTEFIFDIPVTLCRQVSFNINGGYLATNLYDGQEDNAECSLDTIFADPIYGLKAGHLDNSQYFIIGGSISIDTRDSKGQPSRGNQAAFGYSRHIGSGISGGNGFDWVSLDLSHYQNIWHKRLIALRFYAEGVKASSDSDEEIPVYLIPSLGGIDRLRGFKTGRFLDNYLMLVSAEYRYPIYDHFDAFIFFDEGRVFETFKEEAILKGWNYSAGFGIRIWDSESVIAVVQLAKSREATRLYLELGAEW